MKTALLYFSTLLAVALADKPSPTYSSSVVSSPSLAGAHAPPTAYAPSPQASYSSEPAKTEAAEPVAPSTQGFYYYYYPVASSYEDNSIQNGPAAGAQGGYGGGASQFAPDRQEQVGSGISGPLLGVMGVIAAVAVGAAVFMSGSTGRRAFSDAFTSVDMDDIAYYVYEGIRLWTDVERQ